MRGIHGWLSSRTTAAGLGPPILGVPAECARDVCMYVFVHLRETFTHVCICTCSSETLVMCVYLVCSLLEPFEGFCSQVQLKTGVKLEGWDFLAYLGEFEEAFTSLHNRDSFPTFLSEIGKLTNVQCKRFYLSCFEKHSMGGELLWASSEAIPSSSIPPGYLQTEKISISIAQWRSAPHKCLSCT